MHRKNREFKDPSSTSTSVFPDGYHLNVITAEYVQALGKTEPRVLFRSGSRGILAAKESKDGLGIIAISDCQNVIIHQVKNGLDRSYRLKGTEVYHGCKFCNRLTDN